MRRDMLERALNEYRLENDRRPIQNWKKGKEGQKGVSEDGHAQSHSAWSLLTQCVRRRRVRNANGKMRKSQRDNSAPTVKKEVATK